MTIRHLLLLAVMYSLGCASCAGESQAATSSKAETFPSDESTTAEHRLANPQATAATQQLYKALWSQYGKKTISGTVASVDWNTKEAEIVKRWTGKYPAINVFDFINIHASKDVNSKGWIDYGNDEVVRQWAKQGGIVGCMWHWQVRANNGIDYTCTPGTQPTETSFDPTCISNTASEGYKQLVHDIDQVAGYLKKMQKNNIPVIWRPLHEAAGNTYEYEGGKPWFWWGAKGAEAYKKLWRFLYDRLVNYHKLNNLIWVWNSQMGDHDWYPGDDVVDVVGRDSYYALQYPLMKEFKQLQQEYPNKLITLAECGNGDEVQMSDWGDIWQEGSRWSWLMTWYDYDYDNGKSDAHKFADATWWQKAFATGTLLDREQMRAIIENTK